MEYEFFSDLIDAVGKVAGEYRPPWAGQRGSGRE